jgi:ParB family transcriptional regulator, chromosome partitioning protein
VADDKRRNLGRGLSALLGDSGAAAASSVLGNAVLERATPQPVAGGERAKGLRSVAIGHLRPGKFQPRRHFDEAAIADLVESVRDKGILQPILVRHHPDDPHAFEIIAGERRWRAAQRAQLHEVPVIIRDLTDKEALEVALVENLQRQDLTPLEEADGYRRLIDEFSHTQEELAKAVGKSRSHVANMMRLLALPESIKVMVDKSQLSAGHARALLTAADPVALARQVVDKGLNVRQTEKLAQGAATKVKGNAGGGGGSSVPLSAKDADTVALERDLTVMLGVKVAIRTTGAGGDLTITYGSLEQLDDILSRLTGTRA